MPKFMTDLRGREAVSARALEFLILTNARTDAVVKATCEQFDLDARLWTVPLASLKDREHRTEPFRVPLSRRAVEIVREMETVRTSPFVFAGSGGSHLSNMALLTLLKRMNSGASKWLARRKAQAPDHGSRFQSDVQDVGRGDRNVSACCRRTGHGASGREQS